MPRLLLVSLVLAIALVRPALAADEKKPARPAIMVLGLAEGPPSGPAGFLLVLRTLGALDAIGGANVFHPKQVRAVLESHGDRFAAYPARRRVEEVGKLVGADWAIAVGFTALKPNVGIAIDLTSLVGSYSASKTIEAPTLVAALDQVPGTLAVMLDAQHVIQGAAVPKDVKIAPLSSNEDALLRYAECAETLNRQPIGIREPVLVDAMKLDRAVAACEFAVQADKGFFDAKAALGLAYALKDNQEKAERWLKEAKSSPILLGDYAIAKFWIISRFYDRNRAIEPLQEATAKNPGFLLARGYLGDALTILERYDDALAVFNAYLEAVPRQPWVMARIGLVSAKRGDVRAAVDWSKKALAIAPNDPELLLEMASREVDAKDYKAAEVELQKILALGNARGEVHLRLGYVYLETNRLGPAEAELERAIEKSTRVLEWRTRGRARYDLAKMWMRAGLESRALEQLKLAVAEGYRDWKKIDDDPDLKPLQSDPKFKSVKGGNPARTYLPKYSSPYKLDLDTAEISSAGPESPKTTVVFHF
jgi:tetratricopeptide (TPR) repeat protein